jgi:hypothetical protein
MLFRHCVFPVAFSGKAFRREKYWRLYDAATNTIEASVACERFAPDRSYVHAYGCRLAAGMNVDEERKKGGSLSEKNRRVYCGAYALTVDSVRKLAGTENLPEISSADVIHKIENNEIAHAAVLITVTPGHGSIEATKTAIIDRLSNSTCGPLLHTCECDSKLNPHPSARLPPASAGSYVDSRTGLEKIWCKVRFRLYRFVLTRTSDSRKATG